MSQLVWVIIGIGLLAAAFAAGQNYVSPDGQAQREMREKIVYGFHSMSAAYNDYTAANNTPPSLSGWQSQLVPAYLNLPIPVAGATWTMGNDATYGDYFCLTVSLTSAQYSAALKLYNNANNYFAPNSFILNTSGNCGSRYANLYMGSIWPASFDLTYWLAGQ